MDWAIDIAGKHDTNVTLWEGYYKGPTYTEFPVTHFFYNKNINLDYTYGNSEGIGNVALMPTDLPLAALHSLELFLYS